MEFDIPTGTAIRFDPPAAALAKLLPAYGVFDSEPEFANQAKHLMLPGWARIWIGLSRGPIAVQIGNRKYDPLPSAGMYGVTSRAMSIRANGGVTVAIEVSPLGWARFVHSSAAALRDRITPLDQLLPPGFVRDLTERLRASDADLSVKQIVDDAFLRIMPPPHPSEPMIERLCAIIGDDHPSDLASTARQVGMSVASLQRLSNHFFGFPPKLLMMRARFLRALTAMIESDGPIDHSVVPPGYYSVPHFLRDADRFLGMTPRRFLAMDMPYLRPSVRFRKSVGRSVGGLAGMADAH